MELPSVLKGESIVRLLQGTAIGAIAAMIIGFNWGGWVTGSKAETQASSQTKEALVAALAPICVENFQASADMTANLAAFGELSSYKRTGYIEEGGWAVLAGNEKASSGVAKECGKMISQL